ncbi:thiazole biosynthesis family protein [Sinorhizobium meliloti]|nr:thiazole biosynthesis family protein [Sinorhizobium meliloti]MDX1122597.1 thiazole biosynthesis family protein [Sinorhizobium medicae]
MLTLYGSEINSRLLLGTARYPSPAVLSEAVRQSATEIVTVSLRREMSGDLNPSNWTGSVLKVLQIH